MIYVDTSVVLARLFSEPRVSAEALWSEDLVASRLVQYEVWSRIHARGVRKEYAEDAREILGTLLLYELSPLVLARALEPFPVAVRTLDGLHLATMDYLRSQGQAFEVASYDDRFLECARRMKFKLRAL